MPYFLCRLNPPRPTFALDMTDEEQQLMGRHAEHWGARMQEGRAILFGVVGDPQGPWGMGVLEADDEDDAQAFTAQDPVIRAGAGFGYDVFPMPNVVVAPG